MYFAAKPPVLRETTVCCLRNTYEKQFIKIILVALARLRSTKFKQNERNFNGEGQLKTIANQTPT